MADHVIFPAKPTGIYWWEETNRSNDNLLVSEAIEIIGLSGINMDKQIPVVGRRLLIEIPNSGR